MVVPAAIPLVVTHVLAPVAQIVVLIPVYVVQPGVCTAMLLLEQAQKLVVLLPVLGRVAPAQTLVVAEPPLALHLQEAVLPPMAVVEPFVFVLVKPLQAVPVLLTMVVIVGAGRHRRNAQ
jgi:hypothetical protein